MLRILIIGLLKDIQSLINHDVFSSTGDARREKIDSIVGKNYPHVFRAYFSTVEPDTLRKDSVRFIKFLSTNRLVTADCALFKALQAFIIKDLRETLTSTWSDKALGESITVLRGVNQRELDNEILAFSERFPGISRIQVQSALALSSTEKALMVKHFNTGERVYHVTFTVDPSLLGGMRVFKDGTLHDASFARRIGSKVTLP